MCEALEALPMPALRFQGPDQAHWKDADKLRIVEESLVEHRQASATARRHGISQSLLTTWRRQFRRGELGDIDPQAWLADVLARLPDIRASQGPTLLPWNWQLSEIRQAA